MWLTVLMLILIVSNHLFSSATLKNSFKDKDELVFEGVVQKKNKLGKNTVCLLPCAVISCWGTCWFFSAALRYKRNWVILVESFSLLCSMFFALIVFTAQINSRYIYRCFSRDGDSSSLIPGLSHMSSVSWQPAGLADLRHHSFGPLFHSLLKKTIWLTL